jgi:selenocysteine lyase/cysteine desulfurase
MSSDTDPAPVDWAALRRRYPAACDTRYLNVCSRGLLSQAAHAAGVRALDADRDASAGAPGPQMLEELRARFGRLIGAPAQDVAVTKNVSEGLNAVCNAIEWRRGDNVVLCGEVEHPNNVYLWLALAGRGVELRDVAARAGVADAAAMAEAMDARTRIVTVSAVSFVPGFRADLARLGAAARAAGALFLVDAVQATGVVHIDVERDAVDALATSTSKGLLGSRGLGFLYVREAWARRLRPLYIARNGIDSRGRHYSEFEGPGFTLWESARRFEVGNYNYTGVAVAHASIAELLAVGPARIEMRAVSLARTLADGLSGLGYPVNAPPAPALRSHIVTLGRKGAGGPDATGDPLLDRLSGALHEAHVRHSIRRNLLRFAFHLYNDESDVRAVLDAATAVR